MAAVQSRHDPGHIERGLRGFSAAIALPIQATFASLLLVLEKQDFDLVLMKMLADRFN